MPAVDVGSRLDVGPSHRWSMKHEEEELERGEPSPERCPTAVEEDPLHLEPGRPGDGRPGAEGRYSDWACRWPVRFEAAADEL